jgi:hypothetical protein
MYFPFPILHGQWGVQLLDDSLIRMVDERIINLISSVWTSSIFPEMRRSKARIDKESSSVTCDRRAST